MRGLEQAFMTTEGILVFISVYTVTDMLLYQTVAGQTLLEEDLDLL